MKKILCFLLVSTILGACSEAKPTITLPATPPPFKYMTELPEGEFLFVYLNDDDYTCLDGLCACAVSEAPALPYEFRDGLLFLNPYFFSNPLAHQDSLDWKSWRASNEAVSLWAFWSQWDGQLQFFSSFPYAPPEGGFTVLGMNSQGAILVWSDLGYAVVPANGTIIREQAELYSPECKVLHHYTLTNYGLIRDENVRVGSP